MVEKKDVVLALLGASAGLSGLVLVFLGLVVTTYQRFDGATPAAIRHRYRKVGVVVLITFGVGVACLASSAVWLIDRTGSQPLYVTTVALFGLQIIALVGSAVWAARRILWES